MATMTTSDGTAIYFESFGKGRPLVFIPGYSGSTEIWMYQIMHLGHAFNCVVYDPRGHGRSDKPIDDYSWQTMAADLNELIEHLQLDDPILVGWSMGGGIAASYALNHRMPAGMVLVAPTLPRFTQAEGLPFGMDDADYDNFIRLESGFTPEFRTSQFAANFFRSELTASAEWLTRLSLAMPPHVGVPYMRTLRHIDLRGRLDELDCPILICHSEHDRVCDPGWTRYLVECMPNAEVSWYTNSGHALMLEEHEKVSEDIAHFTSRAWPPPTGS